MPLLLPSIYWPIASCGFSRRRGVRRLFQRLFSHLYRKRLWNLLINSWMRTRGFDHRGYIRSNNVHAVCSAILLVEIAFFLCAAHRSAAAAQLLPPDSEGVRSMNDSRRTCYRWVVGLGIGELVFNMPAIVLTRYLYLLTLRRCAIQLEKNPYAQPALPQDRLPHALRAQH